MEEAGVQVAWSAGKMTGVQTAKFKSYGQTGGLWRHGLNGNKRWVWKERGTGAGSFAFTGNSQGEEESAQEVEMEMDSPELEAVILRFTKRNVYLVFVPFSGTELVKPLELVFVMLMK